jgi:acyl-CoA oxidase
VDVTFEGDNTVMMQQAARPLVDAAAKRGGAALAPPPPPAVNALALGPGCARKLLEWRRDALTAEIAAAAAAAGARGGAAAAAAAVDAALDRVVLLGWASVDAATHADFLEEARGAPPPLRPALERLALLYGLSRVEAGLPDLLAGGALPGAAAAPLRAAVNALCAELAERGGAAALALCDGFGVPDHLLQAPIALEGGWRRIGG